MGQELGQDVAGKAHSLRGIWHLRWGSQMSPLPGLSAGTHTWGPFMHLGLPHGMVVGFQGWALEGRDGSRKENMEE